MGNENGVDMSVANFEDNSGNASIGLPIQKENYDGNTSPTMRRSPSQKKIFDNNGGTSKAGDAGTVNGNSSYGSVTYGCP